MILLTLMTVFHHHKTTSKPTSHTADPSPMELSASATTTRPFTITEFAASTQPCPPRPYQALMTLND